VGLAIVLAFIGVKMLLGIWDIEIRTGVSLAVVVTLILLSMAASIWAARHAPAVPVDTEPAEPPPLG
jgi:tellurite resistance protein TerC